MLQTDCIDVKVREEKGSDDAGVFWFVIPIKPQNKDFMC